VPEKEDFQLVSLGDEGDQLWQDEKLHLNLAAGLTGVRYLGELPVEPYEVELEARRLNGSDFFCGLTVPVRDSAVTLIVGGWGGGLVGISSLDEKDASENETCSYRSFENERWYHIRLVVENESLEAWIDGEKVIDVDTAGKALGLRPGPIEQCGRMGLATWQTEAEFRSIRWR